MKPVEVGLLAALALLEHLVELGEHVLHPLPCCSGVMSCMPSDSWLNMSSAAAARAARSISSSNRWRAASSIQSYCWSSLHLAGEVGRELVELLAPLLARGPRASSWRRLSPDCAGLVDPAVDAFALLLDDLVELLGDVLVDAAEVVAVELLAALLAQLLEHLAQAHELLAVRGRWKPCCIMRRSAALQVAVVEQVVGHLVEERVGVEVEADLRAVPPRVREPAHPSRGTRTAYAVVPCRCGGFPAGFWWGTGASSTQAEGAAPASDWCALERAGHVPPIG